jgi:hypothetical protein
MSGQRAWHVVNRDGSVTKETEETLHHRVVSGSVVRKTLVWTPGMAEWMPAAEALPGWFRLPAPPEGLPTSSAVDVAAHQATGRNPSEQPAAPPSRPRSLPVQSQPNRRRRSYISRHWRGELPLAVSWWVNGFLVLAIIVAAEAALKWVDLTVAPRLLTTVYAGLGLFAVAASVWQLVGVWRSSGRTIDRHIDRGELGLWAVLARLSAGLAFLSLIGNSFVYTLPNVWANLQIAFGDDPTPRHTLRLLNRGTEIEVSGGIDFGAASELETLLNAAPAVRVVDLASPGGWVAEAEHMRDLIRARHLATYTDAECASACTVIYMGGYPRYLGPRGKLGFHRYSFPGQTPEQDADANREGQQDLIRAGVDADFAARAFSTPSERIWEPDKAALLSARVVTQEVDGWGFAAARADAQRVTREELDRELATFSSYAALRRADPAAYEQVIELMQVGFQDGGSMGEIIEKASGPLDQAVARFRKIAGDDVQVRIAAIVSEEARILAPEHPDLCLAVLDGSSQKMSGYRLLPEEIKKRENELTAAIIDSGFSRPSDWMIADEDANAETAELWRQVRSKGIDIAAVGKRPTTVDEERSICIAMGAFMAEVAALPAVKAGPLMRNLADHP